MEPCLLQKENGLPPYGYCRSKWTEGFIEPIRTRFRRRPHNYTTLKTTVGPFTLLFGQNMHGKSLQQVDAAPKSYGGSNMLPELRPEQQESRPTPSQENSSLQPSPPISSNPPSQDRKVGKSVKPPDSPTRQTKEPPPVPMSVTDTMQAEVPHNYLNSSPSSSSSLPPIRIPNSFHEGLQPIHKLKKILAHQSNSASSFIRQPWKKRRRKTVPPTSQSAYKIPKLRNRPNPIPWDLHYRYLERRLNAYGTPNPYIFPNRHNEYYHDRFLKIARKYQYVRDVRRRKGQRRRFIHMFAMRKLQARQHHLSRLKWNITKAKRQKLYKLAYLRFKRKRLAMLERRGKLKEFLAMGWSAHKEWKAWLELRNRLRFVGKRGRKRAKLFIPVDDYQRAADRRFIDLCTRYMRVGKRKVGKDGMTKVGS